MEGKESKALGYLPDHLRAAAVKAGSLYGQTDEIRLRLFRQMSLTIEGRNILCGIRCTREDLEFTVDRLCQGSLYSHADSIREGVITTDSGIRAGVAGRAVMVSGKLECVRDVSSVCIRIPHRIPGAADEVFQRMGRGGVLVFSPPGCGKTTILRELIPLIAETRRTAVIDTRHELCIDDAGDLADVFAGYPRTAGIGSAVRTMSPEVIVCDEIMGSEDRQSIREAYSGGVTVCASVHGRSVGEIMLDPGIRELIETGVFRVLYGRSDRSSPWKVFEEYSPVVDAECGR